MKLSTISSALFAAMALSCGGDAACVPGEQVECACAGGVVGAQACNADGSGFNGCSCDGSLNPSGGGPAGGDPCDAIGAVLTQQFETKYDQCDIEPPEPTGGAPEGGAPPCTAELQAALQCYADCNDQRLTCGVLSGDDLDAATLYVDCTQPCGPN